MVVEDGTIHGTTHKAGTGKMYLVKFRIFKISHCDTTHRPSGGHKTFHVETGQVADHGIRLMVGTGQKLLGRNCDFSNGGAGGIELLYFMYSIHFERKRTPFYRASAFSVSSKGERLIVCIMI